jgi:hypothetical protein
MGKQRESTPYWAESVIQAIYHLDCMCHIEQGRGVWVTTSALKEAVPTKWGSYHTSLLKILVNDGWLDHQPGKAFVQHKYRLSDYGRAQLDGRFQRACLKCEVEK